MPGIMPKNIVEILDEFQRSQGIDPRVVVYDYTLEERKGRLCIDFYTSLNSVAQGVRELFASKQIAAATPAEMFVHLLPDESVGEGKIGVCNIGTASIYRSSSYREEQTNQALLGESFDVLQVKFGEWLRIRLHRDGYLGWLNASQAVLMAEAGFQSWKKLPRGSCIAHCAHIRELPKGASRTVRDTVVGVLLPVAAKKNSWRKVLLPDGSAGWMRLTDLGPGKERTAGVSAAQIVRTAEKFLGVPYQWGGRSPKGFDCSGLVQTVFSINGIHLPRDAGQQWSEGNDAGRDVKGLRRGDLVFFSEHPPVVSHVGVYTGKDGVFIHSRGYVRCDSLDPESGAYSRDLASMFIGARRIVGIG